MTNLSSNSMPLSRDKEMFVCFRAKLNLKINKSVEADERMQALDREEIKHQL